MTNAQRKALDGLSLGAIAAYVDERRQRPRVGPDPECPYAKVPGDKGCDNHDYDRCTWSTPERKAAAQG